MDGEAVATRDLRVEDADDLASLQTENRAFLAPWDPERDDDFFTSEEQRRIIVRAQEEHEAGRMLPLAIVDEADRIVGRINLNGITRGAFQSASVGYWVSESHLGQGLATCALRDVVAVALGELGLHRLQAETLIHNVASQKVLRNNGFLPYGIAPTYLKIAGRWQDHILYQLIRP
ncbi:MAG TPA: GNAT family protein [Streptosporangiaceae bacterium]|nr:GNAT family protein [Streptosporangiaceae bacterium]